MASWTKRTSAGATILQTPFRDFEGGFQALVHLRSRAGFAVRCFGELDITTCDELRETLEECFRRDPRFVHIDLTELTFIACAGIEVILEASACYRDAGGRVRVSLNELGRRLVGLIGYEELEVFADA